MRSCQALLTLSYLLSHIGMCRTKNDNQLVNPNSCLCAFEGEESVWLAGLMLHERQVSPSNIVIEPSHQTPADSASALCCDPEPTVSHPKSHSLKLDMAQLAQQHDIAARA